MNGVTAFSTESHLNPLTSLAVASLAGFLNEAKEAGPRGPFILGRRKRVPEAAYAVESMAPMMREFLQCLLSIFTSAVAGYLVHVLVTRKTNKKLDSIKETLENMSDTIAYLKGIAKELKKELSHDPEDAILAEPLIPGLWVRSRAHVYSCVELVENMFAKGEDYFRNNVAQTVHDYFQDTVFGQGPIEYPKFGSSCGRQVWESELELQATWLSMQKLRWTERDQEAIARTVLVELSQLVSASGRQRKQLVDSLKELAPFVVQSGCYKDDTLAVAAFLALVTGRFEQIEEELRELQRSPFPEPRSAKSLLHERVLLAFVQGAHKCLSDKERYHEFALMIPDLLNSTLLVECAWGL